MNTEGTPIYWILFWNDPTTLNDLDRYRRKHYGCHIEKPEQPKQVIPKIPVNEELKRLQSLPPMSEGRGY